MSVRCSQAEGFTLIEVMVSIAIVAVMMTLIWSSFSLTVRSKEHIEKVEERYHQVRLAMNRMAREISMAFLSMHDEMGTQQPRTRFVSQRNSSIDELLFSSFSHMPLQANAKESDQSMIRYFSASDPQERSITNLMRRESRRLGSEHPGEDGPAFVMIEDIEELHFKFFDEVKNEWRDTWNTMSVDGQPGRLPQKVKITLTLREEGKRELTFATATKVFMQDALWFTTGDNVH
jgi:general secretion pathway protein J